MIVTIDLARDQHAWEIFPNGQLQVGVVLVVAQEDVVFRDPLLDQVIFERQRFDDRVGHDDFQPLRLVEQGVDAGAHALGAQVRAHAVAQDLGLADVQSLPTPVVIQVNAGLLRQAGDLGLEVTNRHALHCKFLRVLNLSLYGPDRGSRSRPLHRPHRA